MNPCCPICGNHVSDEDYADPALHAWVGPTCRGCQKEAQESYEAWLDEQESDELGWEARHGERVQP